MQAKQSASYIRPPIFTPRRSSSRFPRENEALMLMLSKTRTRRRVLFELPGFFIAAASPTQLWAHSPDPWTSRDLIEPERLANTLGQSGTHITIICVAFPVLYRQRHIPGAELAGPASKEEGLNNLRNALGKLSKGEPIVLYCGCCPMSKCPNIRPAYTMTKGLGFSRVNVLNLHESFHADWVVKGYPVEPALKGIA